MHRTVIMAIQFSVLIILHCCLVLVTTAEDYKCLPLVLRQACCWINENYTARNVIVFVSILINFLAAMINIVSSCNYDCPRWCALMTMFWHQPGRYRNTAVTSACLKLSQLLCDFDKPNGLRNQTFNESTAVPDICFYPEVLAATTAFAHLR